jgi:type VI secretion system protein ImpF
MKGFEPSLFDKLFPGEESLRRSLRRLSVEELKESVARDIESLLNMRMIFTEDMLARFPQCQKSILTYGMDDFAGRSLASHYDRVFICRSLEQAIARHEQRLKNVKVALEINSRATSVLFFAITAILDVGPAHEPVAFDATLQPSTLQYSVNKGRPRGMAENRA